MTKKVKFHTYKRTDLVESIVEMRIKKGMTRLDIKKFLMEQCKLSQSYSYELIKEASGQYDHIQLESFGDQLKEDIERFEMLYQEAIRDKNKKEAREVLKEISKLKGHYTQKIEHSGEINTIPDIIKIIEVVNGSKGI